MKAVRVKCDFADNLNEEPDWFVFDAIIDDAGNLKGGINFYGQYGEVTTLENGKDEKLHPITIDKTGRIDFGHYIEDSDHRKHRYYSTNLGKQPIKLNSRIVVTYPDKKKYAFRIAAVTDLAV